jgi:hypothetical protein
MTRSISALRFALSMLALLSLAGPAAAGQRVPFKATVQGISTRTLLDSPFVLDEIEMSGTASHLGQVDVLITATVNLTTRTAVGTYEFVAANGDVLVANFTGSSAPTSTPGVILITELGTIDPDASTGRFAGATGTFTCERLFTPATGETIGSIAGTISSAGASKH